MGSKAVSGVIRVVFFVCAALAVDVLFGDIPEVREGDFTVRFKECPKCPMRARFEADGRTATINTAKVSEQDRPAMIRRALELLKMAESTKYPTRNRPLMGWSTWNTFGLDISDTLILDVAKAMATNGLKAAGYRYVNIDDGFFNGHDERGRLKWELKRFPNGMKGVVDGIHALGLKAGTYSDAGIDMCGGNPGSGLYGHDESDCDLHFKELGFDFIKVDYCGGNRLHLDERTRYTEISRAIRATGRDVHFNVCRWAYPGTWISEVAESWRTTGDIRACWDRTRDNISGWSLGVKDIINENRYLSAYASPGHYNDMDMLEIGQRRGQVKTAFGKDDPGITVDEELTHFGMWCLFSSPLMIGCDVRTMSAEALALATNPYLLAMSQNDLGLSAYAVQRDGEAYVFVKDAERLHGTARFVALYNGGDEPHEFTVPFSLLDLGGEVAALDLAERADIGVCKGGFTQTVEPHATRFYRFDAAHRLDRKVYEAEDAFLTEYQELRDGKSAGTAHPADCAQASGGTVVGYLGNRASNDLVWKDVYFSEDSEAVLAFDCVCSEKRAFYVQIDGLRTLRLEADASPDGQTQTVRTGPLKFASGSHTIRLFNAKGWMPDMDRMTVENAR